MIAFSTQFALITLAVALLIAVVRLVKGPTLPDRVVAMDLVGVLVVGLIVVLAASTGVRAALDAAVVIALVAFVSTVAYGTYVNAGPGMFDDRRRVAVGRRSLGDSLAEHWRLSAADHAGVGTRHRSGGVSRRSSALARHGT